MSTGNSPPNAQNKTVSIFPVKVLDKLGGTELQSPQTFTLSTAGNGLSEVILDYGRAEGGIPFFETCSVESNGEPVLIDAIYSETSLGLTQETGDGPFFLFSNAMDTYRINTHAFEPSAETSYIESGFAQKSQRYQKIVLKTPNSTIQFSSVGFRQLGKKAAAKSSFTCSNSTLEKIWSAGVRTVEMCTVEAGETLEAWEVTEEGTKVAGQHWAPCRQGTRWGDYRASFEVRIESAGASWGVHMVANGLIFCLDVAKRSLSAFEGLSDSGGVFPTIPKGSWTIPAAIQMHNWLEIVTTTRGAEVDVKINGHLVANLKDLNIHPILGGSANNTGSVAFGGPAHYSATYRSLVVRSLSGETLYENNLSLATKSRTMEDFAVGTNELACTIDGAKRDRACFAGDIFVMGRSVFYSTGFVEAVLGSITLLSSHQTAAGYMGNLCPIQAPVHREAEEPPTYAFYSLSYSLALVTVTKDYVMHTGDLEMARRLQGPFQKLLAFTSGFQDERGLVVAPPPLSMDWFPMCGPIFGASGKINLAFYEALRSMSQISALIGVKDDSTTKADQLRESMRTHLWSKESQVLRMSDLVSPDGICQDIHAYGLTTGIISPNPKAVELLKAPLTGKLPLAFQKIERWDAKKVISPYASGFAAEALFNHGEGHAAVELIERVWGGMVDPKNPNYSGGLWEAMAEDGTPITDDTSLMHGWSTWPVFLLPQYLAGLRVLAPGWARFQIQPVLAGIEAVDVRLATPAGDIGVSVRIREHVGAGSLALTLPGGSTAELHAPPGWTLEFAGAGPVVSQVVRSDKDQVLQVKMAKIGAPERWNDKRAVETRIEDYQGDQKLAGSGSTAPQEKGARGLLRRIMGLFCK